MQVKTSNVVVELTNEDLNQAFKDFLEKNNVPVAESASFGVKITAGRAHPPVNSAIITIGNSDETEPKATKPSDKEMDTDTEKKKVSEPGEKAEVKEEPPTKSAGTQVENPFK